MIGRKAPQKPEPVAVAAALTSSRGLYAGEGLMTGWPVFHDPIEGDREWGRSSPSCVPVGEIGVGRKRGLS